MQWAAVPAPQPRVTTGAVRVPIAHHFRQRRALDRPRACEAIRKLWPLANFVATGAGPLGRLPAVRRRVRDRRTSSEPCRLLAQAGWSWGRARGAPRRVQSHVVLGSSSDGACARGLHVAVRGAPCHRGTRAPYPHANVGRLVVVARARRGAPCAAPRHAPLAVRRRACRWAAHRHPRRALCRSGTRAPRPHVSVGGVVVGACARRGATGAAPRHAPLAVRRRACRFWLCLRPRGAPSHRGTRVMLLHVNEGTLVVGVHRGARRVPCVRRYDCADVVQTSRC